MTEETMKKLNEAEGTIKIDIDGLVPKVDINVNNIHGLFIGAKALISSIAYIAGSSESEALVAVTSFVKDTKSYAADSREQVDVIKEILKQGVKIDDLM